MKYSPPATLSEDVSEILFHFCCFTTAPVSLSFSLSLVRSTASMLTLPLFFTTSAGARAQVKSATTFVPPVSFWLFPCFPLITTAGFCSTREWKY